MAATHFPQDIVVTGVGAVTPLGQGAERLHRRWCAGEIGIEDGAARCNDFDPTESLSRKEVRLSDRFTQLALGAAQDALDNAGWLPDLPYDGAGIACVVGTSVGGIDSCLSQYRTFTERGPDRLSPLAVVKQMPNAAAAMITQRYGFLHECNTIVGACASSTQTFTTALRLFSDPTVDAVVMGGTDAQVVPETLAAFTVMGALSVSGVSRPFDRDRDGFVLGEGAGMLVLEREQAARARNATVVGRVVGAASTTDAYHLSAPEPSARTAARAISRALDSAGLTPSDVDYVNAHGTASWHNDRAETLAIKNAFGERAPEVPISSTKSALGHLVGAAGAVEAIATLMALRDGVAPPTLGLEQPDVELDLDYVPGSTRSLGERSDGQPLTAISNSFGLGGHNAVVVLQAAA